MSAAEWVQIVVYGAIIAVLLYVTFSRIHGDRKPAVVKDQVDLILEHVNDSFRNTLITMTNRLEDHFESEYGDNYGMFMEQIANHLRIGTDYARTVEHFTGRHPGWVYYVKDILEPEDETQAWEITLQTGFDEQETYLIPWSNMAHCIDCLMMLNKNNQLLVTRAEKTLSLSKF